MAADSNRDTKPTRKLAAILAADISGYSALMGVDEEATVRDLKGHFSAVVPMIEVHGGRVISTAGDGILAEFASAINAVKSALAIQTVMAGRNADIDIERQMQFRIGINLGDLIYENANVYGDGINIAARLESIAEPGGICASEKVYQEVVGKVKLKWTDMGEQTLKNIARTVHAYGIAADQIRQMPRAAIQTTTRPTLDDKPSVAVLPFDVMGSDVELDGFADGLTEDIITGLSRIKAIWVIARNTMFVYKHRAIDVRNVAKELGVRYVLEGSVRRLGGRMRITAQLIEANSGHHIWAEKIDRSTTDLFDLQDEVTNSIVASVQTQLILSEGKASASADNASGNASRLLAQSWQQMYGLTAESIASAEELAARALALEPKNTIGHRMYALLLWHKAYLGFAPWSDALIDEIHTHAKASIEAPDADEHCHWAMGMAHLARRQHDRGVASLRRAVELNPNFSLAYGSIGTILAWAGQSDASITNNEMAIRINPLDPSLFFRHFGLALAHYLAARYPEALAHSTKVSQMRPTWYLGQIVYCASLAQCDRTNDARGVLSDLRRGRPDFAASSLNLVLLARQQDREHLLAGLRKAGLSDE